MIGEASPERGYSEGHGRVEYTSGEGKEGDQAIGKGGSGTRTVVWWLKERHDTGLDWIDLEGSWCLK